MTIATSEGAPQPAVGPWTPFRTKAFAVLWVATVISNVGTWMHDVGAGWLMTELSPSPFVVAMVQAATTLPVFLFALLAGAIADIVDRRKHLIFVNALMCSIAAVLALSVHFDWITPTLLIVLTFLLGTGAAFMAPAWQAIVPKLVERPELPAAIALNSMGINVSRAIGPALAGFLIVSVGLAFPFIVNALSFIVIIAALVWWQPTPTEKKRLPPETVARAIAAGLRYAANSGPVKNALVRAAGFFAFASAFWAMLPLIARELLEGGPTLYGVLLAAVGGGAVLGAIVLPKVRASLGPDKTVAFGTAGTAAVLLTSAAYPDPYVVTLAAALAGISWIAVLSSLHVAVQTALPEWVRARGLSIFLTVFFGAMSFGSLVWGKVATELSIEIALISSAVGALLFIPITWRATLGKSETLDLTPSMHWPEPVIDGSLSDDTDHGPVMIQIVYQVPATNARAFDEKMLALAEARRRYGAFHWSLMRDSEAPERFVETWYEASWQEHLRHHERVSGSDKSLQEKVHDLLADGTQPQISHYLDAAGSAS